jgi:hypothetical protein
LKSPGIARGFSFLASVAMTAAGSKTEVETSDVNVRCSLNCRLAQASYASLALRAARFPHFADSYNWVPVLRFRASGIYCPPRGPTIFGGFTLSTGSQ